MENMVYFLHMILRISQKQLQKTILAPSMQQSIEILLLAIPELHTAIEQELEKNPLLEIDEEKASQKEKSLEETIAKGLEHIKETPNFSGYKDNFDDEDVEKMPICYDVPLEQHLRQQLSLELTDPLEIEIGEFIVGNLNEDGYLDCSFEEIQQALQIHDRDLILKVLKVAQSLEPLGIASRDIKECLSVQASVIYNGKSELLVKVINEYLEPLCKKRYDLIARKLKLDIEKVKEISACIASLEPKPARNYRPVNASIYIKPDISIIKDDTGNLKVQINQDTVPPLRVSKIYSSLLKTAKCSQEEKEYIREKVKNAILFIKSIEQRHNTLKEIAKYILEYQKDFFSKGSMHLRPMILKDVANAIDRNESTVSRAINNKYMDTPCGIFSIKYFFSQSLSDHDGGDVSNRSIKEELKWLIEGETKTKPLSDREIHLHFERKNMKVARRTITKYRKALNILPAYLRKQ